MKQSLSISFLIEAASQDRYLKKSGKENGETGGRKHKLIQKPNKVAQKKILTNSLLCGRLGLLHSLWVFEF